MRVLTRGDRNAREETLLGDGAPRALLGAVLLLFVVAYAGALVYAGGLSFEPIKDEEQFWTQVESFALSWPPTAEQLRNYGEPMTPVAFLVWAGLESWHHLGIAGGRLVTLISSIGVLGLIVRARPALSRTAIFSALALLLYPYWLPMSLLLYTDVPTAFFVVLGYWLYARKHPIASAFSFAVAIGARQYAVAFPAALVAYEGLAALRARAPGWSRWMPYAASAATLVGWFVFFGGLGPSAGLENWPRHSHGLSGMQPDFALYALAAIGAYFVVPEFVVDRRWRSLELRLDRRVALALVALGVCFAIFPPLYDFGIGPLNRALLLLGDGAFAGGVQATVLLALAGTTVARFARLDLASWVVAANVALMPFLWSPWEKYYLPVLAALWLLKAAAPLDDPQAR